MADHEIENPSNYKYQLICVGCGYTIMSDNLNSDAIKLCPNCGNKFEVRIVSAPEPKYSRNNPYPHK